MQDKSNIICSTSMKISVIQGNEKVAFSSRVPSTESCAKKNCDEGGHERPVKHYFPGNIPHQWTFQ